MNQQDCAADSPVNGLEYFLKLHSMGTPYGAQAQGGGSSYQEQNIQVIGKLADSEVELYNFYLNS